MISEGPKISYPNLKNKYIATLVAVADKKIVVTFGE